MHKNIDASMGNNPIKALVYHNTRKKFNEKVIFLFDFKKQYVENSNGSGLNQIPKSPSHQLI